jgi:hypothetical protein
MREILGQEAWRCRWGTDPEFDEEQDHQEE